MAAVGFAADVLAITVSVAACAIAGDGDALGRDSAVFEESIFDRSTFGKSALGKSAFDDSAFDAPIFDVPDFVGASDEIAVNAAAAVVIAAGEIAGAGGRGRAVACEGGALSGTGEEAGIVCGELKAASLCEDVFGSSPCVTLFRLIEPVTESSPCSRAVMRANSRSRSPFNVSIAEARRFASLSLVLAIDWNCRD